MNFLQRLNPFYLRKELQRTQLELAISQNNYERVLSNSEILQNNYERVLSDSEILQQTYDDNPELIKCGGVEQYLNGSNAVGDYKSKYTKRELKLLLDLHLLRQDNNELRDNVEWSNVCKADELKAQIKELKQEVQALRAIDGDLRYGIQKLTKENDDLVETNELLSDLCVERTTELKQVKADLEKTKKQLAYSKKVNEAWFNAVLGYGVYDNILLNKAFWGEKLELVDLPQVDSDERNS